MRQRARCGWLALVALAGGEVLAQPVDLARLAAARPAEAPAAWLALLGRYEGPGGSLLCLEQGGSLVLLGDAGSALEVDLDRRDRGRLRRGTLGGGRTLRFERDPAGRGVRIVAGSQGWDRVFAAPELGERFTIEPTRPRDELLAEALAASPPAETGQRPSELVDLLTVDDRLRLDIRYATADNFMGMVFYSQPRAFLQRPAAEALREAHTALRGVGYGLVVFDAYRPWYVTRMFWDATPEALRAFVADPSRGSRHNRGCAVDLTLVDLATGQPVTMPSDFDEFSPRAAADYPGGSSRQRWYRRLLREAMAAVGFTVYPEEWWHYDFAGYAAWPIGNQLFEALGP